MPWLAPRGFPWTEENEAMAERFTERLTSLAFPGDVALTSSGHTLCFLLREETSSLPQHLPWPNRGQENCPPRGYAAERGAPGTSSTGAIRTTGTEVCGYGGSDRGGDCAGTVSLLAGKNLISGGWTS